MWSLSFITEEEITNHVEATIKKYGDKLNPYDIKKFNSNIVDPIKLLFDKNVYQMTWDEIIKNEIFRQRDKSNSNDIGYFHQNIFQYFPGCTVLKEGWDVLYENVDGIELPDGHIVRRIFAEIKNKHNTMNASSSAKTYKKMEEQVLDDDECACYLVETIAKRSQNVKWTTTVDKRKREHKLIRRVSMDQFYSLVTGEENAFYRLCMELPRIIKKVLSSSKDILIPNDIVFNELMELTSEDSDTAVGVVIYMLGFEDYVGFRK